MSAWPSTQYTYEYLGNGKLRIIMWTMCVNKSVQDRLHVYSTAIYKDNQPVKAVSCIDCLGEYGGTKKGFVQGRVPFGIQHFHIQLKTGSGCPT